uniref:Uncharacterized protein n=1 Tax=Anguilla anguilla TaxID=7936 RepID=A0A0E9R962_ANGAN
MKKNALLSLSFVYVPAPWLCHPQLFIL